MSTASSTLAVLFTKLNIAPAAALLAAMLLLLSGAAHAQIVCDNDGIAVQFDDNPVELKDVKVKEITGDKDDELEVVLANPGVQFGNMNAGVFTVSSLNVSAFPDNGITFGEIYRDEGNAWKAEYPKHMYDFADKSDLYLEFEVTVIGGEASHVFVGSASTVSMSITDAGIDAKFHGGKPRSLKQLRGDLDFRIFDLLNLTTAGVHRANISLCVNVRGHI